MPEVREYFISKSQQQQQQQNALFTKDTKIIDKLRQF